MRRFYLFVVIIALSLFVLAGKSYYNAPLSIKDNPMLKPFSVYLQYLLPQHALSNLAGKLGDSTIPWLKNALIKYFVTRYHVDMTAALHENPYSYTSFNNFFMRQLKPALRPICPAPHIASPVDGFVSQIGKIDNNLLLQAKGFHFSLASLLGGSDYYAELFAQGQFATLYLSPKDYHRVHMPIAGRLRETIFVPGKLFSVNTLTSQTVPNLFARNERLISIFDTDIGPMAVIMVGAMLVGSIETIWHSHLHTSVISYESHSGIQLEKGEEMGKFKMGSTVILLFPRDTMHWDPALKPESTIKMGQALGMI